jgi:hypothetical protein
VELRDRVRERDDGAERSVTVEFSTLDFLYRPELNARVGVLLLPMGILNEVHEPPFYSTPAAGRGRDHPHHWSEYGAGVFGRIGETPELPRISSTG